MIAASSLADSVCGFGGFGAVDSVTVDSVTVHSLHGFAVGNDSLQSVCNERGCGVTSTACLRYRHRTYQKFCVWGIS